LEFFKSIDINFSNTLVYVLNIIDILVCTLAVYWLINISKKSKTWQVLWGLVIFIILVYITDILKLHTANFLVKSFLPLAPVAIVLLFYPDLRKLLENMGSMAGTIKYGTKESDNILSNVVKAACAMSASKTGGLIVFEKAYNLDDFIANGIHINADVSDELLRTIFYFGTPLHDGAVIIRKDKIEAASCTLPLTQNENYSKKIHTRHKAAIGITDITDAVVVVISEETGTISIASGGTLTRHLNERTLTDILRKEIIQEQPLKEEKTKSILKIFKAKNKEDEENKEN